MDCELIAKPLNLSGLPPSPREGHNMLLLDSHRILIFGGGCNSSVFGPQQFNDLFLIDLHESKWSHMPSNGDLPSPRTGQSAVLLEDGRVLIFGGSSMATGYTNEIHILDTKDWRWSRPEVTGRSPSPRDKHSACLLGDKLYIFGGFGPIVEGDKSDCCDDEDSEGSEADEDEKSSYNGGSSDEEDDPSMSFTWFNDLHVLDIRTMQWEALKTLGTSPTPRAAHAAFVLRTKEEKTGDLNDKMVIFGGRDLSGRQNGLFSLDIKTCEWRKELTKAPAPRSFHVMEPLGAKSLMAISYGGIDADGGLFPGLEVLNFSTKQWVSLRKCVGIWPPIRGASSMVIIPASENCNTVSQLIVFGGSCSLPDKDTLYFNDVFSIDLNPLLKSTIPID